MNSLSSGYVTGEYLYTQNQGRMDLLGFFDLAIPVFHSYGHKVDCQVICMHVRNIIPDQCLSIVVQLKYSPRNKGGFGLTDGEVVERLWAYLRRFCKMTKEMRPSHCVDVLTAGLLHYSRRSAQRLSKVILCG